MATFPPMMGMPSPNKAIGRFEQSEGNRLVTVYRCFFTVMA
jgi:hypothetical protein